MELKFINGLKNNQVIPSVEKRKHILKNEIFIDSRRVWDKFIPFTVATESLLEQK